MYMKFKSKTAMQLEGESIVTLNTCVDQTRRRKNGMQLGKMSSKLWKYEFK